MAGSPKPSLQVISPEMAADCFFRDLGTDSHTIGAYRHELAAWLGTWLGLGYVLSITYEQVLVIFRGPSELWGKDKDTDKK